MVRVDRDLLAESLEHVAVMLQRIYNCQQLLVIDLVVELGWAKLSAMVRDRVQQSILAVLGNHCAKGEVRGIRLEDSGLRLVEVLKDRRFGGSKGERKGGLNLIMHVGFPGLWRGYQPGKP